MIPIPEGAESYSEESTRTSGYGDSQEALDQPGMLAGSGGTPEEEEERLRRKADKDVEGLCDLAGPDMDAMLHGM